MATSGTVSTTSIDVDTLLAHAIRRCGVSSSEVTAEHGQIAKEVLYFYLSNLVNHGVSLWTISRDVYGLVAYTNQLALPTGTEGVLNANKRTIAQMTGAYASSAGGTADNAFDKDTSTACIQTSAGGNISLTLGTAAICTSIGIMAYGTIALTPVFEYTEDGTTWQTVHAYARCRRYDDHRRRRAVEVVGHYRHEVRHRLPHPGDGRCDSCLARTVLRQHAARSADEPPQP